MSFSTNLEGILAQYFPNNTAPSGLQAKIDAVYDSSNNIGAFDLTQTKPKYSNKQVDVTFNDQDFEYRIIYNDDGSNNKIKTFYASIPDGIYDSSAALYEIVEHAFQEAVFFEKDGTRKNLSDHLGFNVKWKIVDRTLKLLIPNSVSNFAISDLRYRHVVNINEVIDLSNNIDLSSAVITTWNGDLDSIPVGGIVLPFKTLTYPYKIENKSKIYFNDVSGDYYFTTIPNGTNTTINNLMDIFETACAAAYYRDLNNNKVYTSSRIDLSFNTVDNTLTFKDDNPKRISKFGAINQNAYEIYGITDETGLLSGIELSQLTLDNRTGNFNGPTGSYSVVIDPLHNTLKYEVIYVDASKVEQVFVDTVTFEHGLFNIINLVTAMRNKMNQNLSSQNLGDWVISRNKIRDPFGFDHDTDNIKIVYDASGSLGNGGMIEGTNKTIKRVHFLPVANDAYQQVGIQGEIYNDVKIKNNIVYNKTGEIKSLPDAGLIVSGSLQYQIIYTDGSGNYNQIKTTDISDISFNYVTVENLASAVQSALRKQDPRWSTSWLQATQKFNIQYDTSGNVAGNRRNVQIKFIQNSLSDTLGISQLSYNTATSDDITISVNPFIKDYVTIPANAAIEVYVNNVLDLSANIESKSYLSGDEFARAVDQGNLLAYWKEDHLELAWNKGSQRITDIVTLKAVINQTESASLTNLLKLGAKFFQPNGVHNNRSTIDIWEAVADTTHSIRVRVPKISDLFPDVSSNIIKRFFPDASDNILDIYRLTEGLKDVIIDHSLSYQKVLGITGASHVMNDYDVSQNDLRIEVFLGGATAGSQMYPVAVTADSATRRYNVYVTQNEFSHIGIGATGERELMQNMIDKTYKSEFYEMVRDNVQVKTKELVEFILHEWIVAVNNDPQSSDYLKENLIGDLKNQVLSKIAPDVSNSVFTLLSDQEYATLVQAFQNVLPEANGSSYIALRTLKNNNYLADPLEIYNALRKDNDNIYDKLGIDNKTAQVEEFLKEYYDRLLRSYAELVRQKLLPGGSVAFKPSNLAVALAASVELNIGTKGTISEPSNMNEYFNTLDLSSNTSPAKLSDLINAIAHNIYDISGQKTSTELLIEIMTKDVSNPLTNTLKLLNTTRNEEHVISVHGSGVARTGGLGLQNEPSIGHRYLTAIMMSHHLLHKILADGSGSLFFDNSSVTEERWNRLMLAYEQEGRCLPVGFFSKVNYSDVVTISDPNVKVRFEKLADVIYQTLDLYKTYQLTTYKNITNLYIFLKHLFQNILGTGSIFSHISLLTGPAIAAMNYNIEYLCVGKHHAFGKTEGILRYYIDTLYNFLVLEGTTTHPLVVFPFYKFINSSELGKGLTHSLFYRLGINNDFVSTLGIIGSHYSLNGTVGDYLTNINKPLSGLSTLMNALSTMSTVNRQTQEQIDEVIIQKLSPLDVMNDKMRVRIFGNSLSEDPTTGRVTMSSTPEMQAQVNQMKLFESYIQRFSDIDQGLLLGLLIQYDKRLQQQELTSDPSGVKLSSSDYLNEIHNYLSLIIARRHISEAEFLSMGYPFTDSSSNRIVSSRSLIDSFSSGGNMVTKAQDVIVLQQNFEIIRDPAVDLWKNDVLAAINIENVRYNIESGSPNDISEFLNMYEKAVNEIEASISSVVSNQAIVGRTLQLLTTGLSGTTEQRILAIQEATREASALDCSKEMLDSLVVIIGILNVKIEQLIAAQQELDVKIASYNRLVAILQSQITDLQNVYSALPPQYNNFADLAQTLSECLALALKKRDEVSGKISQLRMFLDNAKLAYSIQKDYKINKIDLPELRRGFTFTVTQKGLFQ